MKPKIARRQSYAFPKIGRNDAEKPAFLATTLFDATGYWSVAGRFVAFALSARETGFRCRLGMPYSSGRTHGVGIEQAEPSLEDATGSLSSLQHVDGIDVHERSAAPAMTPLGIQPKLVSQIKTGSI